MNLVYKHGQRYGLLPRSDEGSPIHFVRQSSKSDFEPVILTLPAFPEPMLLIASISAA